MEFEFRDNDTGKSYTVTSSYYSDTDGCGELLMRISAIIAYAVLLIGLTLGTISVATTFPAMLFVLIALDIFALMPFVGFIIYLTKLAKHAKQKFRLKKSGIEADDEEPKSSVGKETLSLWKYMVGFLGRFGYIMFYFAIIAYWVLYFCNVNNTLTLSLMFLCMYGMYYFPYMMFHRAKKCNSLFASIMGLASIYAGVTAACVGLAVGGESFALSAPVLLPTVMGVFAMFCLPIQQAAYNKNGEGRGPLKAKTILLILGISVGVLVFALTIISMNMNK